MNITKLFLCFWLLSGALLSASNPTPTVAPLTQPGEPSGPQCDLPAPFNFHVEKMGTTWMTMSWGGNTQFQHRLRVFRHSDNVLLSTTIVSAGVSSATLSVPFDTEVEIVINAICLDGTHSPHVASHVGKCLVLDLVVVGFNGSSGNSVCEILTQGECELQEGVPYNIFQISINNQYPEKFAIAPYLTEKGDVAFKLLLAEDNSTQNNNFNFYCMGNGNPNCSASYISVKFRLNNLETVVAIIEGTTSTGVNTLTASLYNFDGNYSKLQMLESDGFGSGGGGDRSLQTNRQIPTITATPNPFDESLSVHAVVPENESINIQLFDLSGRCVFQQQFSGGQTEYFLPLAGLSPGFYWLRAETGGQVQNLKVLKSE